MDIQETNPFICKFFFYLLFSIGPVSPWLLVMVSLDRMLKVKRPTGFAFLKKRSFQLIYCAAVIVLNFAYYVPQAIFKNITIFNETEADTNMSVITEYCYNSDENEIVGWMDLLNSTVLPFTFMILFSSLTIIFLVKSRRRALKQKERVLSPRDIKFSVTSIAFNVAFLVLNIPIVVLNIIWRYMDDAEFEFYNTVFSLFFYINFGMLFYINFFFNSIFRDEVFAILGKKKLKNTSQTT
jgi:hypothetical protein